MYACIKAQTKYWLFSKNYLQNKIRKKIKCKENQLQQQVKPRFPHNNFPLHTYTNKHISIYMYINENE